MIKDFNDEPHFAIIFLILSRIQMNILFKTEDEMKRRMCVINIQKYMIINFDVHETNKKFAFIIQPKNACKLEFAYHFWLLFLDQPQSSIVVFVIITFQIYYVLVSKWKHGIVHIDIITFNEELEFLSASIIELINIDESLHENEIVIFITKKDFKNRLQ